jgi:hypothetical protein
MLQMKIETRIALLAALLAAVPAQAQHVHDSAAESAASSAAPRATLQVGAHAVPLLTHISPILQGRSLTEGYVTQPTLLGRAALFGGAVEARAAVSLEALTIERGELGAGAYGEGYVDRRHPHTYLHEAVISGMYDVGPVATSLTAGRGFVAFGTDDPMMRPFVKFPVNHHLGQILERIVVIGGVRAGPLLLEGTLFNGNEPLDAKDMGSLDRFGDSWAARATLMPVNGLELQASRAWVTSPEMPPGDGHDQRKWSASARFGGATPAGRVYALAEWKSTTDISRGLELFSFGAVLGEVALERGGWRPALRFERADRPEEQRTFNPFRTPWPHAGAHGMGMTQWTTVSARVERELAWGVLRAAPFIEASHARVTETAGGVFEPGAFYGSTRINAINIGARVSAGWHPPRMGRYGVAADRTGAVHAGHAAH